MRVWINNSEFQKRGINIADSNFSEIAVNYIQDNYFNGADNAVIYMGGSITLGMQEFEIMPC